MDAVTLAAANAAAAKRYARKYRRWTAPVLGAVPAVMTTPPTFTVPAAGAASVITSSVLIRPETTSAFTYLGAAPKYGATFPFNAVYSPRFQFTNDSLPPWSVEFVLDTVGGAFEVYTYAAGGQIRVRVNGQLATTGPSWTVPNDSGFYNWKIDLGAAGRYRIRLELGGNNTFGGIRVGPTDGVAAYPRRGPKVAVVGDSFVEPTISDSGAVFTQYGFVQVLADLTGWDCWSVGSGGTGYLAPGPNPRVKIRDRLAPDVLALNPDMVILAAGLNDRTVATAAQVQAEVAACLAQLRPQLPGPEQIIVTSPFWGGGFQTFQTNLLAVNDAIKAAAAAAHAPFLDLLTPAAPNPLADSTLTAAAAAGSLNISSGVNYPFGSFIRIGTDTNSEVRQVGGTSGTGPYVLSFGSASNGGPLGYAHTAGEVLHQVDQPYQTGAKNQATPDGSGNSDRYTGTDATHPTYAGHVNLGHNLAHRLAAALTA